MTGKRENMIGNKNAEKWTEEKAVELFDEAITMAYEYDATKDIYKYDFIGEIARELKLYKEIFTFLKDKHEVLIEKHKEIVSTLEANCFYNSKKGNINTALGIVNLKSNHDWTDRADITSKGDKLNHPPIFGNNPLDEI